MYKPDWALAPADATHWDNELGYWCDDFCSEGNESWGSARYTPRPTSYDGTGMPPVGAVCYGNVVIDRSAVHEWRLVKVLHNEQGAECVVKDEINSTLHWCYEFGLLKSVRELAISEMLKCYPLGDDNTIGAMYDAGYRKESK